MDTKIITDSCFDNNINTLTPSIEYEKIPFKIMIDDQEIVDKDLNIAKLIDQMELSHGKIGTACPSPNDYYNALNPDKMNYIITVSGKLSGSHNSAMMAKKNAEEEGFGNRVHVFDTESACCGENLTAMKIAELIDRGLTSQDIVPIVRDFINNMTTLFTLNSLNNLVKNGRIRPAVALVGKLLKVSPIMMGSHGEIELKEKVRGKKKSYRRLAQIICEDNVKPEHRILGISHVNVPKLAEKIRDEIINIGSPFEDIVIFEAGGLSTVYADKGGIIIAY